MSFKFESIYYGMMSMDEAQVLQKKILEERKSEVISILGLQHPEVLSLGQSLWDRDFSMYSHQFQNIYKTPRGGQMTLHNEGQLIIYPVFNIREFKFNIKTYVCFLLECVSEVLNNYGVITTINKDKNIGLYVDGSKLLSIGLKYSQSWVSQGMALNICNDLSKFQLIDVCGIAGAKVTSLRELGLNIDVKELFCSISKNFEQKIRTKKMVRSTGLEPVTTNMSSWCSTN